MGRIKILFCCFLFTGILFIRQTTARFIHLSSRTEIVSYVSDPPLLSAAEYSSSSLVPAPSQVDEKGKIGDQEPHKESHHHDKSVAGGGVIIGGLVTVVFATLYCYIKVTRKRDGDK
ncbi:hypothetical protein L1987_58162 [Smallanthus sonchifolius]|uniref:Uncharacterized protein n=1 Tax=Smallanthus sonchifolius TaxID=185202 RepID=A0ACB9DFL9_9ASTR|nr:hypothetical protein L1987_58162 [Smallanthus sonchifolius]